MTRIATAVDALAAPRGRRPHAADVAMSRTPLPPFTAKTAAQKPRMSEDAWTARDPARVALADAQRPLARGQASGGSPRPWRFGVLT